MLYIVLDTNAYHGDPFAKGPVFLELFRLAATCDARIAIPQVVKEELVRIFQTQMTEALNETKRAIRHLSNLDIDTSALSRIVAADSEEQAEQYRSWLDSRFAGYENVAVCNHSEAGIEGMVLRAFAMKDQGTQLHVRDALVWESVVHYLETGNEVAFITRDGDFVDSKSKRLKDGLLNSLGDLAANVTHYEDVGAFLNARGQQYPPMDLVWLRGRKEYEELHAKLKKHVSSKHVRILEHYLGLESPAIDESLIDDESKIEIAYVRAYPDGGQGFIVAAVFDFTITGHLALKSSLAPGITLQKDILPLNLSGIAHFELVDDRLRYLAFTVGLPRCEVSYHVG